jgi:hypothetical protein
LELNWPACRLQRQKAKINRALAYKSGNFFSLYATPAAPRSRATSYTRVQQKALGAFRGRAQKRRPARGLKAAQEKRSCGPATLKLLLSYVRAIPTGYMHDYGPKTTNGIAKISLLMRKGVWAINYKSFSSTQVLRFDFP